jgi:hypothetical protein
MNLSLENKVVQIDIQPQIGGGSLSLEKFIVFAKKQRVSKFDFNTISDAIN